MKPLLTPNTSSLIKQLFIILLSNLELLNIRVMTFWGFIIIICKVLIALVGLVLLIVLVNALLFLRILYRALPSWKSVSPSDKVWTSDVYAKHFISPEKWRYIETFLYETFIPYDQIRPELVDNENAFTSEVFRLLWDARNAYGKLYYSRLIMGYMCWLLIFSSRQNLSFTFN